MQFSLTTVIVALAGFASATTLMEDQAANLARRQSNANRPVPSGACCVANTSLKQDFCNVNGQQGGDRLTCVAQQNLVCDPNRTERGREFCREK
ncbi:uncharacterized protein PG998_006659 [Apiospora kogelbergensis]|uniref:uncharacterized protein n=1 Tax=Apiospora kogelbergensis TaxID=1337665 RepID=UPI003130C02F